MASLSKPVTGGLRVAFAVPPPRARPSLFSSLVASMWTPPPLTAEIARRWIDDGTADQAVEAKQREAAMRLELLRRRLGPLVPELRVSTRLDMSISSRSDTDVPKDDWLEKKNG